MATTSKANRLILHALMILVYISSIFHAFDLEKLEKMFNVEMEPGARGSCDRINESNGQPMLPKVLIAFEDAFLLVTAGVEYANNQINARDNDEDSAQAFTRLRAMLFFLLGIRINSAGQFDDENLRIYNDMLGEFQAVDDLNKDPPDAFGYGKPKLWCLDDYSNFYTHLVDADGVEDENLPLAAQHFDQKYPPPSHDFLPGLFYAPKYDVYYRGPDDDPESGFCEVGHGFAYTKSIMGPFTPLWGITLCDAFFGLDDLSTTEIDAGTEETSQSTNGYLGPTLLAEMLILVSTRGTKFQPPVVPDDDDWTSTDWSQWNFDDDSQGFAVSLEDCINLGLAKPSYARKNAPNYVHFALCLVFEDLDCSSWLPDAVVASATDGPTAAVSGRS